MGSCASYSYCNRRRTEATNEGLDRPRPPSEQVDYSSSLHTDAASQHTRLNVAQSNSDQGSLSNFAALVNNSISFNSTNSNPILIANTLTNTTTSYYNSNNNNSLTAFIPPTGKNKRLKKDFIKYFKLDKKITESQLNAKREEFWDTAPAFEGKIEIWSALKAAVEAYEEQNFQLAQAIIDSANIILPKGFLNDCYDELGNRYQLPTYVLAKPINMIKSDQVPSSEEKDSLGDETFTPKTAKKTRNKFFMRKSKKKDQEEDEDDYDEDMDELNSADSRKQQQKKANNLKNKLKFAKNKKTLQGSTSFAFECKPAADRDEQSPLSRSNSIEETFAIKVRVSSLEYNENDVKLKVTSSQTVAQLKALLRDQVNIEPSSQRMFFGGKLMKDKDKLKAHKIRKNVVVQVIVRQSLQQPEL